MVPMRDGIKLPTIIALPGSGSYPVVLTRGYTASGLSSHAGRFNKAGYAFVSQQCRGGGGSDGTHIVLPIILVLRSEALLRRVASDRGTK